MWGIPHARNGRYAEHVKASELNVVLHFTLSNTLSLTVLYPYCSQSVYIVNLQGTDNPFPILVYEF